MLMFVVFVFDIKNISFCIYNTIICHLHEKVNTLYEKYIIPKCGLTVLRYPETCALVKKTARLSDILLTDGNPGILRE